GQGVSAAALAALLFGPAVRLADVASVYEQAVTSLGRLAELSRPAPAVADPPATVWFGRAAGRIEFDGVGFGYHPGRPGLGARRQPGPPGWTRWRPGCRAGTTRSSATAGTP